MRNLSYFLAVLFVQIGLGIVGPVLPDIKSYFAVNMTATGLIMSSYGIARVVFDLPGGLISQKLPVPVGMCMGIFISICGSLCSAVATNFSGLIWGSFIAGAGSAIVNVVVLTLLTRQSDYSNRGKILGIYISFFLAGVSIGPAIGGILGAQLGWRSVFFCSAVTSLIALAITLLQLFHDRKAGVLRTCSAVENEIINGKIDKKSSKIDLPAVITVNIVTFTLLFALEGFNNTIIPLYGSLVLGLSPYVLGLILTSIMVVRFLVGLAGGVLSDKYGRVRVLIPCLLIAGFGIVGVFFAFDAWSFLIAALLFAVGRMGNNVPLALLGDLMPSDKIAWMTALNRFIADGGLALGPLVLGFLTDRWGFSVAGGGALIVTLLTTCSLWLVFRKRPVIYQEI